MGDSLHCRSVSLWLPAVCSLRLHGKGFSQWQTVLHCGRSPAVCFIVGAHQASQITLVSCLSQAATDLAGFVHQPGRTGPSWLCVSARPQRSRLLLCLSQASTDPAGFVLQPGRTGPSWLSVRPGLGPSWFRGSARSSDPACCGRSQVSTNPAGFVPQLGRDGPSWFVPQPGPLDPAGFVHQPGLNGLKLVLCFSQASTDPAVVSCLSRASRVPAGFAPLLGPLGPAGDVTQPGLEGPGWFRAAARP